MMAGPLLTFLRDVFDPRPHSAAKDVSDAAQQVENASEKLADRDELSKMVRGMRGEATTKSSRKRGRRRK